ncbi:hypothetical protein HGM15179_002683, partial [Zosterops borbonicus]
DTAGLSCGTKPMAEETLMSNSSQPGSSLSAPRVFAPPTHPTQSLNSPVPPPSPGLQGRHQAGGESAAGARSCP